MNQQRFKTTNVLGYEVFSSSLDKVNFDNGKILINTYSPNSYGLALKDKDYRTAIKNTDLLVLDGMGAAIGSIILHGKNIKKIAGQDCFDYLMAEANKKNWKVFYLGSSENTLQKMKARANKEYPNVPIGTYSPPYKETFTAEDNKLMVDAINAFEPHILFIGMTAPKQEKWGYFHLNDVSAKVVSTIGNVFDWYAGNSKRPGKIWIKLRLEWFIRIFLRPEIFRRNTKNQMMFFKDLLLHISHIKRIK